MSDNITIKELLDLSEGIFAKMSDITLEASIKEVRQAYERTVKSGDRAGETFYSQKLVIDDGTGSIVVDFIAGTKENIIPKTAVGRRVSVEGAKTDVYKGERRLARGKLIPLEPLKEEASGVSDPKQEERDYWDNKQKRQGREITRIALAKSLIAAGWTMAGTETKKEADRWFEWVMDGVKEEVQEAKKEEPKSEESNEIAKVEVEDEKETPQRAALRKTFHSLKNQLTKVGFWNGEDKEDSDYRNWLDDEFQVPSSSYLDDKEMEKGIKIMAKWLNKEMAKKKEAKNASD